MIALPSADPTADDLADWVELSCLFGNRGSVGSVEIADALQEEIGVDDFEEFAFAGVGAAAEGLSAEYEAISRVEASDAAAEGMNAASTGTETALRQLSYRSQIAGGGYPVAVTGSGVSRKWAWSDRPVYPFLSLLGARMLYKFDWPYQEAARLFERVVAEALRTLLAGEAVRFGWPRLPDEPLEDFPSKVRGLARHMGEDIGRMRNIGPNAKDYDLDVIAWRPFRDGKTPGQLIVVCQCAIGEDWSDKLISISSWMEVIAFNVRPVGALAFPGIPSRESTLLYRWHDVTSKESIPLDRLRLASLLDDQEVPSALLDALRDWIGRFAPTLPFRE